MSSRFARPAYEIKSPRLIVRTATNSDAEDFYDLMTNPENFPFEEPEKNLTIERLRTRIDKFTEFTAEGKNAFMVVVLQDTNQLIGYGGYNTFESIDPAEFLTETTLSPGKKYMTDFGIIIDHRYRRKGYGLELISALVEYARVELDCELFRAETGNDNESWRAFMRAVGLTDFEGRHKASYDANQVVWVWKFDSGHWDEAKEKMQANGKWLL
ncbi:gcn5-related n-acetyltransferase [Colletotrichum incanum]|uniref:Gcn5-related n-acetyltransferase n=1 Tax=Colletotrichum incanum TaxID=1573173 RepID=A0A167EGY7_COLIC|nr:gcn5-related n-acetyltransferase [Colletotrichum incanum]OHW96908.1 acetyltransferase [Colletotrichum incanum]